MDHLQALTPFVLQMAQVYLEFLTVAALDLDDGGTMLHWFGLGLA